MTNKELNNKNYQDNEANSISENHTEPIDLEQINGNDYDFYSANSDYLGSRVINKKREIVDYRDSSTVRIWYNEQSETYPSHWHNTLEIIVPVQNCYYACVNESTYCIQEGEIFFIPPGELHTIYPPPVVNGTRFVYLFDLSTIAHLKDFSSIKPLLSTPLHLKKDASPDIYNILMQIQREYFSQNLYSELTIYSLLISMIVKLGTSYANKRSTDNIQTGKQREYLQQFNDLLAYIDEHYMDALTLEDTASLMGFSKFHFSRLFKDYTGYTFCDYLNYRRIKATEELLPQPDLPITQIAMQVGFSSISTFNRLFRTYKKCSPTEYRSKMSFYSLRDKKKG